MSILLVNFSSCEIIHGKSLTDDEMVKDFRSSFRVFKTSQLNRLQRNYVRRIKLTYPS